MKKLLTQGQLSVRIVFAVLIIDQIIKILVKTNMYWHESIRITDWFYIYFTENNGMAFGMDIFEMCIRDSCKHDGGNSEINGFRQCRLYT